MLNISFLLLFTRYFQAICAFFLLTLCRRLVIRAQQCSKRNSSPAGETKTHIPLCRPGWVFAVRLEMEKGSPHFVFLASLLLWKELQKFPRKRDFCSRVESLHYIYHYRHRFRVWLTNILVNGRNKRSSEE